MANTLLMPKATAVWLVDNTALSFDQIAQFCKLHPLEVKAIADGEAAQGIKGIDPIMTGQLTRDEIARGRGRPDAHRLKLSEPKVRVPESKRKGPRYTPLSKRQDRPERHPLAGAQPSRTEGRADFAPRRHHQVDDRADPRAHPLELANLVPMDPVTLGLCSQIDLDLEVNAPPRESPPPKLLVAKAGLTPAPRPCRVRRPPFRKG
jgi:hypothetical protein